LTTDIILSILLFVLHNQRFETQRQFSVSILFISFHLLIFVLVFWEIHDLLVLPR